MKFYALVLLLVHVVVCTTVANEFLTSKWNDWFNATDVNHDGTISNADIEKAKDKFYELLHLDAVKERMIIDNYEQWLKEYILMGKTEISQEQFVEALSRDFMANKTGFYFKMQKCFKEFFNNVCDTNEDGFLSRDEFLVVFKVHGHENLAKDNEFFDDSNPKNGLVDLKVLVSFWIDFTTSEDSTKPNFMKDDFEAGA